MSALVQTFDELLRGVRYAAFAYFMVLIIIANRMNTMPYDPATLVPGVIGYSALIVLCSLYFWRNRRTNAAIPLFMGIVMSMSGLAVMCGARFVYPL